MSLSVNRKGKASVRREERLCHTLFSSEQTDPEARKTSETATMK